MFRVLFSAALLPALLVASAFAESLPLGTLPPAKIATPLPSPALSEDASPTDFLRAAENALAAGRTGEAQEAMEMAQTRLLDRSVPLGQTHIQSDQPAVKLISQGLQALTVGDRITCLRMIQAAIQVANAP